MKAIVTGGAGFVGTNLIKRLLEDGHEVVSLDDYSTGNEDNKQSGCKYIDVDVSDSLKRHKAFGLEQYQLDKPDVVFHLAALARIQPSFENPQRVFQVNTLGTQNILDWCRQNGDIPVVYAGSSSSHGDLFANPYTFTKWQGELLCEAYNKIYKSPVVVTRFYNVYGDYQILDGAYAAVIGIFQKQYSEGKTLTVTGTGEQRRDFTHVKDIVDGLVKSANILIDGDSLNIAGKIFELGRGKNYSINEITKMFGQTEVEYIPARPGEMMVTLCKSLEARELLGWNPTIDIEDYIKEIINK